MFPSIEGTWGPWFAALLGLVWVVALVLLSLHLVRRRTGWYARKAIPHPPPRAVIWIMDALIFVLVCLFGFLVWRSLTAKPASFLFSIGLVSGVFAFMCIAVVIREDLSLRRRAAEARSPQTSSDASSAPLKSRKRSISSRKPRT